MSEISETASDAWSTDVLASDTDEKNSELLKELDDQVGTFCFLFICNFRQYLYFGKLCITVIQGDVCRPLSNVYIVYTVPGINRIY